MAFLLLSMIMPSRPAHKRAVANYHGSDYARNFYARRCDRKTAAVPHGLTSRFIKHIKNLKEKEMTPA